MKGNDGKARRQQLQQRFVSILALTATILLVLHFSGIAPLDKVGRRSFRRGKKARLEALRKIGQTAQVHQRAHPKRRQGRVKLLPMREALSDPNFDPHLKKQATKILAASSNLVSIEFENEVIENNHYDGVIGVFCSLDFASQKENPSGQPMFRDVVSYSRCADEFNQFKVDLNEAVELAREFDTDTANENLKSGPTVLELQGVVFHESRCGSTLAANSLVALDPVKNRVYSESSPPIAAMKACGEEFSDCSVDAAANLLKDVIYLMGRTNDPNEENLFFKFQSITTRMMQSFRKAFPTTPWIFLYREPVQVMMSQLDVPSISRANCVRSKTSSVMVHKFVKREGYSMDDLDDEEFCAVHLATLCESALRNLEDANGLGMAVKYSPDLVHDFLDSVFPKHFKLRVDKAGRERVLKVSGTYSKLRGQKVEEFKPDSENKEKEASTVVREASKLFLEPSYVALGESPFNINKKA